MGPNWHQISLGMKKSSICGKQNLDYLLESRGPLVLHLGGVGKYVSQIQGWSVHPWESGNLWQLESTNL
jgi:hypothetical protein